MTVALEETGPIDYLVVEFPGNRMTGEGFPILLDLVDRGLIRVLDLVFIRKELDGTVAAIQLSDLVAGGAAYLEIFDGASSGLLGKDDMDEAALAIEPGSAAGILVYENVWAAPFAAALRRAGGQLVAGGRIPIQAVLSALDALDASSTKA